MSLALAHFFSPGPLLGDALASRWSDEGLKNCEIYNISEAYLGMDDEPNGYDFRVRWTAVDPYESMF